jgi:3'-phosphoadenosine 5'-phosphosulfate sulfotransferase (PAPS reductase)/FAD synthetase
MVRITNGRQVLTVTHNAFKEVFQRSGYRLYDEAQRQTELAQQTQAKPVQQAMKPISQWTRKEIEDYLDDNKVYYSQKAKVDDLRDMVKRHMDEAE